MLVSLKANNFMIYNSEVEFSMQANLHHKHFKNNYSNHGELNILKTAIIIGPNNSGKTNFVRVVSAIKRIILNLSPNIQSNLFTDNSVCYLSVSFIEGEKEYVFEIKYDTQKNEYKYERFAVVERDEHKNRREVNLLVRDADNDVYYCSDVSLLPIMQASSRNNILIHLIDTERFPVLDEIKKVMLSFASRIDILDMNNIPIKKTIDMLKLSNASKQKIVNFILNADLSLDDYRYLDDDEMKLVITQEGPGTDSTKPQENALSIGNSLMEMLHLTSVYKGVPVPSMLFDSTGTKKIAAVASYVIDALENERILVIDELDNSLHFKLSRAIIALFNNELNVNAQLIATVHDVSLLDCKTLFRKEQIWFSHKDRDNAYLYPLSEFTSEKDGIRNTTDLIEKYSQGVFGALPDPDLFQSLMEVRSNG